MGNHILHSIKHIKYEVFQQNIILFNLKNITRGYTIIPMLLIKFSAEMVWCRKYKG